MVWLYQKLFIPLHCQTNKTINIMKKSIYEMCQEIKHLEQEELIQALKKYGDKVDNGFEVLFEGERPIIAVSGEESPHDAIIIAVRVDSDGDITLLGYDKTYCDDSHDIDVNDVFCGHLEFVTTYILPYNNDDVKCFLGEYQMTDPDELQFCKVISEGQKFHYIQFKKDKNETTKIFFEKYSGNVDEMLSDAENDSLIMSIINNENNWYSEEIDVYDIREDDVQDIIDTYGLREGGNEKLTDNELNQLICEGYFEQYLLEDF